MSLATATHSTLIVGHFYYTDQSTVDAVATPPPYGLTTPPSSAVTPKRTRTTKVGSGKEQPLTNGVGAQLPATGSSVMNGTSSSSSGTNEGNY